MGYDNLNNYYNPLLKQARRDELTGLGFKFIKEKPDKVLNYGDMKLDYVFIDDIVRGIMNLLAPLAG